MEIPFPTPDAANLLKITLAKHRHLSSSNRLATPPTPNLGAPARLRIATNPRCRRRRSMGSRNSEHTEHLQCPKASPLVHFDTEVSSAKVQSSGSRIQSHHGGGSGSSGTSGLGIWTLKRLAGRIRRTLSSADTATLPSSAALSALATPKRRPRCRRPSSLQRLVRRLATTAADAASWRTPSRQSPAPASRTHSGCVLRLHLDGSRTVRICRPAGVKFGFFVAKKGTGGLVLTRFNDPEAERLYRGLVSPGDEILELEGIPARKFDLKDIRGHIAERLSLVLRVSNECCAL